MHVAFHKPYGVVCRFTPEHPGQRTLAEYALPEHVYPVGRLDLDSEGLLILSDEPGFNTRLLDPAHAHPRTYHAQVEGAPDPAAVGRLAAGGLRVKGHVTKPCGARILDPPPVVAPRDPPVRIRLTVPDHWLELTLTEGKNRQVRRMTAAVGLPTLRLIRVAIGGYRLDGLAVGTWRRLSAEDARRLFRR